MAETEGDVTLIDVKTRFMTIITSKSLIKIFDISKKEYK